jgi:choice-of-anchor A domain-containing protein
VRAGYLPLGTANTYNEFVLGDSSRSNVESQGAVAIGGNATFDNFSVFNFGALNPNALIVGGNLTFQNSNGQIHGNVVAGGAVSAVQPTIIGGTVESFAATGIDFSMEFTFLRALSARTARRG